MNMLEKIDSNLNLIRQHIQESLSKMRSKENQLNAFQESLAERSKEIGLMRESIEERRKQVEKKEEELKEVQLIQESGLKDLELKKEEIKGREEKLDEKEKLIPGLFEKIELERGKFECIQKSIDGRFDEISQKERILDAKLESHNQETQLKENMFSSREKGLVAREKELEAREKVLAIRNQQIVFKEKQLELRNMILDLKASEKDYCILLPGGGKGDIGLCNADTARKAESEGFRSTKLDVMTREKDRTVDRNAELAGSGEGDCEKPNAVLAYCAKPRSLAQKILKRGRPRQNQVELKIVYLKTEERGGNIDFEDGGKAESGLSDIDTAHQEETKGSRIKSNKRGRSRNRSSVSHSSKVHCPSPQIRTFSEFYDFEKDRREYFPGQIWACYDGVDGMPRTYVTILEKSIHGLKGGRLVFDPAFRVIDHKENNLSAGCGIFISAGSEIILNPGELSHQMFSESYSSGGYWIYPRKREIWALFKDREISSCSFSGSHKQNSYEMVEILSDIVESVAIRVSYLKKIGGYVSLFWRTAKDGQFSIWPNEYFKFSHRICSYKMNGTEREGVPKGSFELDPAALPINLC